MNKISTIIKAGSLAIVATMALSAAPAGAAAGQWYYWTHKSSTDCVMQAGTGTDGAANGQLHCSKRHNSSITVQQKVDGVVRAAKTTPIYQNAFGLGNDNIQAWSSFSGCHKVQTVVTATVDGLTDYVTTGTPDLICR